MDYQERQEQLTPSDKKQLQKVVIGVVIFTVFAIGMFLFMNAMMGSHNGGDVSKYIFFGFGVFFFGIIIFITGSATLDLTSGMKTVYTGVITDKETHRGGRKGRKGRSQPKYYLHFRDKKLTINHKHFAEVNVGDEIELHYAKRSSTSLSIVHFNENHEQEPSREKKSARDWLNKVKEERESVEKKEYPLTDEDIQVLRKKRNSKLLVNFFLLLFFTVIALGFGFGAMVNWVFMIPEVIFLTIIYFSFKWIARCFSKLNKDKKKGVKIVAISQLKDKQISSRGSRKGYTITTTYGSFPVKESIYKNLNIGDEVYSFHGKYSNWVIGLHTEKSGYVAE
ncbi:MAG: hypothetical protein ACJA2S_001444 [Cyclobacteriaceae bacterium]|jgi:hypothetical protein